jgi:hypothetical protein
MYREGDQAQARLNQVCTLAVVSPETVPGRPKTPLRNGTLGNLCTLAVAQRTIYVLWLCLTACAISPLGATDRPFRPLKWACTLAVVLLIFMYFGCGSYVLWLCLTCTLAVVPMYFGCA